MKNSFNYRVIKNLDKMSCEQIKDIFTKDQGKINFLNSVLYAVQEAIMVLDTAGKIKFMNHSCEKLVNGSFSKLENKSIYKCDIDKVLYNIIKKVIGKQEKIVQQELYLQKPIEAFYNFNAFELLEDGSLCGYVCLIVDVTENINNALKKKQEDSIQSLSGLTAGLAHEIKNPLGSLDLHLQLVNRFIKNKRMEDKEELSELTKVIGDEIKRLHFIVNDFLFSLRPVKPQLKPDNINLVLQEACALLRPEIENSDIILEEEYSGKVPVVDLDKNYIKNAVINLIKNAAAAVKVRDDANERLVKVVTKIKDEKLLLLIRDNGIGMNKETVNKIFEPYFTTKEKGTGLGLTVVYKIIKEHNGEIIISSEPDKGTEFRIEFPLAEKHFKLLDIKKK
ncbi:MAG TPA: ATP-binding protein [Spirochaetota bacterium]|nr:ATP-binding protein [Spirochaetota bacterium]